MGELSEMKVIKFYWFLEKILKDLIKLLKKGKIACNIENKFQLKYSRYSNQLNFISSTSYNIAFHQNENAYNKFL